MFDRYDEVIFYYICGLMVEFLSVERGWYVQSVERGWYAQSVSS